MPYIQNPFILFCSEVLVGEIRLVKINNLNSIYFVVQISGNGCPFAQHCISRPYAEYRSNPIARILSPIYLIGQRLKAAHSTDSATHNPKVRDCNERSCPPMSYIQPYGFVPGNNSKRRKCGPNAWYRKLAPICNKHASGFADTDVCDKWTGPNFRMYDAWLSV